MFTRTSGKLDGPGLLPVPAAKPLRGLAGAVYLAIVAAAALGAWKMLAGRVFD
jgi:hypothetical protein